MIGIAKKPKKKYSKISIETKSSIASNQQQSIPSKNIPPQVNAANINMTTIHVITAAIYSSLLKFILNISNSLIDSNHASPIKIDTERYSKYF